MTTDWQIIYNILCIYILLGRVYTSILVIIIFYIIQLKFNLNISRIDNEIFNIYKFQVKYFKYVEPFYLTNNLKLRKIHWIIVNYYTVWKSNR